MNHLRRLIEHSGKRGILLMNCRNVYELYLEQN